MMRTLHSAVGPSEGASQCNLPYGSYMEGAMKCCGTCNDEPVLGDLLRDPIVALLMARDGVTRDDVKNLMDALPIRPESREDQEAVCTCIPSGDTTLDPAVGLRTS